MASILSLPDELIEIIGMTAQEHGGFQAWCRLASTCRRLWRLQLPPLPRRCSLYSNIGIEGVAWMLQRVQAADWLHVDVNDLDACRAFDDSESDEQCFNRLQKPMKTAAAACRGLHHLRLLEMEITVYEESLPKRVTTLLHQLKQALLWGSVNLEALLVHATAAPLPSALGCLPKLRYLELTLWDPEDWLGEFFVDVSLCCCLEALRILQPDTLGSVESSELPNVQLSALPNLRRVDLIGWLPGTAFSLPSDCKLFVSVACGERCVWEDQWEHMQGHLTLLSLGYDLGSVGILEWPAGLGRLSRLQYFHFLCKDSLMGDLAVLKVIPHIDIHVVGTAYLTLTDGTWQSLKVHGTRGLCISFPDADAFVRGTERFLFISSGNIEMSQPMCASVRAACSRQLKECYQSQHRCGYRERHDCVRLSNCEEVMRLKPSSDGKLTPCGALHDSYAGTPEDSPLWDNLSDTLVRYDQFWPEWEPYQWVFGK